MSMNEIVKIYQTTGKSEEFKKAIDDIWCGGDCPLNDYCEEVAHEDARSCTDLFEKYIIDKGLANTTEITPKEEKPPPHCTLRL